VVSASRGGLMIAAGEVALVAALCRWKRPEAGRRMLSSLALLAAVTVLLAVIVGFATATERFHAEALMAGRRQFAQSTLHMIREHPWMGWGLGSWPSVYPAFATFDAGAVVNQAHTDWLQWTAEGGLPVGFAMLALAMWAAGPAVRSIWGIGLLAVLVHALFDYPFSRPATGAWPILMLAMIAVERGSGAWQWGVIDRP
jgi:O-antigen ligase